MSPNKIHKCSISWDKVDWSSSSPQKDEPELSALFNLMEKPDPSICKAFDIFYSRFYPDGQRETIEDVTEEYNNGKNNNDPLEEALLPWIGHQVASKVLDNKDYKKKLKEKLKKEWMLSWHWRVALPAIVNWKQNDNEKFIIQISQIRKWELLLFYKMSCRKYVENLTIEDIKGEKYKKELLKAPVFGESHRIYRWDVYRLFYNKKVKNMIMADMKKENLDDHTFEQAYILGRNDCYYVIKYN